MSEINEGVLVLVERMKTNPEEFHEGYGSKWARAINAATNAEWLTDEERKMLNSAANQVKRHLFTAEVLKTLTREEVRDEAEQAIPMQSLATSPKKLFVNQAQMKVAQSLIGGTITANGSPVATQADIARAIAKLEGSEVEK